MDYKAELIRLKQYLQTEIQFINDSDALEDRYARQANKNTLKKIEQILKRGEAQKPDASENTLPVADVSGSALRKNKYGEVSTLKPEDGDDPCVVCRFTSIPMEGNDVCENCSNHLNTNEYYR